MNAALRKNLELRMVLEQRDEQKDLSKLSPLDLKLEVLKKQAIPKIRLDRENNNLK